MSATRTRTLSPTVNVASSRSPCTASPISTKVPKGQISGPQWQLVSESLHAWGDEQGVEPSGLGVRITYLATPPRTADSVPDCDCAVPLR